MEKIKTRIATLILSLVVMMSMCFGGIAPVFADSGEGTVENVETETITDFLANDPGIPSTVVPDGSTITAENLNVSAGTLYQSPVSASTTYYHYKIKMPAAGTLLLKYIGMAPSTQTVSGDFYDTVTGGTHQYSTTATDGTKIRCYTAGAGAVLDVEFSLYSPSAATSIYFQATYAPSAANTIAAPAGKWSGIYRHGGTGSLSSLTQFKVSVPANGYLYLDIADAVDDYSVYYKANGFKDFESVTSSDIRRAIGVKKGVYTFAVKTYSPIYNIRVNFVKVAENKFGAKKKKAVSLKAKKAYKGLIITDAKKAHWYKFKNKKVHKVKITVTSNLCNGSSLGGLRVTAYGKKGKIGSKIIYADAASSSFTLYTVGKGSKLAKGTYYLKVESYNGGNGYFTVKWK